MPGEIAINSLEEFAMHHRARLTTQLSRGARLRQSLTTEFQVTILMRTGVCQREKGTRTGMGPISEPTRQDIATRMRIASWHAPTSARPQILTPRNSLFHLSSPCDIYVYIWPDLSIAHPTPPTMTTAPKQRLQALSEHLTKPADPCTAPARPP